MAILSIVPVTPGTSGILPSKVFIDTTNTLAEVTQQNFFYNEKLSGAVLSPYAMAYVKTTDAGVQKLKIRIQGENVTVYVDENIYSNLDVNGYSITSHDNGNIAITPDLTGNAVVTNATLVEDLNVSTHFITNSVTNGDVLFDNNGSGLIDLNSTTGIVGVLNESNLISDSAIHVPVQSNIVSYASTAATKVPVFIEAKTATNSSSIFFTDLDDTYSVYMVVVVRARPSLGTVLLTLRTSTNNGSSYDSGSTDYAFSREVLTATNTVVTTVLPDDTGITLNAQVVSTTTSANMIYYIQNPSQSTSRHVVYAKGMYVNSGQNHVIVRMSGYRKSITPVNAIQFTYSANLIESGIFYLYGVF